MAWALRRRGSVLLFILASLAAAAALGAFAAEVRTKAVAAPVLAERIGPVRIEGVLAEIDASQTGVRLRMRVRAIEGQARDQTPRFVRFSYRYPAPWLPGRPLACRAVLSPPPAPSVPGDYAFNRDAYFQQLGAVGFAIGACEAQGFGAPRDWRSQAQARIAAIRRAMAEAVYESAGGGGGGAFAAAMTVGDRSFFSPEEAEALRASGLAHLISISGLHMVLAGGAVFFAIRIAWPLIEPLALRIPAVKAAAAGAILALTAYFLVSGGEVATQRTYVIALIGFGAKLFDRPALSLRSLALSMALVVLLQPESVVSPGFQMSFAASAALIAVYEMLPRLDRPIAPGAVARLGGWLAGAAVTSLTASLATLPFAVHHFARLAPLSILANLAASPVITFWTTPAALAAAIAAPLGLAEPLLWLVGRSLEVVLRIAEAAQTWSPDPSVPALGAAGLVASVLALAAFCILDGWARLAAAPLAAASLAMWLQTPLPAAYVSMDGSVFLRTSDGWSELTHWRGTNSLNPLLIRSELQRPCPIRRNQPFGPCRIDLPNGSTVEVVGERAEAALEGGAAARGLDPSGEAQPERSAAPAGEEMCPANAVLRVQLPHGDRVDLHPCALARRGGASIAIGAEGVTLSTARPSLGPWSPRTEVY